jgi:alpha-tubulin suppressor-like RCC1 family protein
MLRVKLQENTQLNLSSYNRKELDFLCRIGNRNTVLSAGGAHTLARTSQGLVYGFGENRSGWLGLGDTENRTTPQLLNVFDIIAVSAGDYHSLILNSQGQVFSFGENYKGQLGAGSLRQKLITIPTLIRRREIGQIMAISAGSIHSLILNSQGQVFSFGSDEEGQLGIGYEEESEYYPAPVRIRALENIIAISAGYDHSLFLNSQGQVYSCGGNEYGQLGIGDDVDEQETPTLIETSEIGKIIAIAAGSFFSLILNSQGQWIWSVRTQG